MGKLFRVLHARGRFRVIVADVAFPPLAKFGNRERGKPWPPFHNHRDGFTTKSTKKIRSPKIEIPNPKHVG